MPDMTMIANVALAEVPVNVLPLLDDGDFKTREDAVAFNAAGMDLVWNFLTAAGAFTQTAVTPTSGGVYDWAHQGDAMYSIEIPKSGGGSINNNQVGTGWFSGVATGVLPWIGPRIEFVLGGEITGGSPSTTAFDCDDIAPATADLLVGCFVTFLTGVLAGATKRITAQATNGIITTEAFNAAPSVGDKFMIVNGA